MTRESAQERADGAGAHLVLYDGACGLCSALVQFLLARDRREALVFASIQSRVGRDVIERAGGDPDSPATFYVVERYQTDGATIRARSDAAIFLAGRIGWPWKLAVALRVLPARVRDAAYGVVARHRYRILGRREQCLIPAPEHRRRFIDLRL